MPPIHAKKPKIMCAHGGPMHCDMGCYAEGGEVGWKDDSKLMGRKPSTYKEKSQDTEPGFAMDAMLMGRKGSEYKEPKEDTSPGLEMDRELLADGGDVDEHEMGDAIVDELMDAMERKDKRGVKDAIEALVMECLNKEEM